MGDERSRGRLSFPAAAGRKNARKRRHPSGADGYVMLLQPAIDRLVLSVTSPEGLPARPLQAGASRGGDARQQALTR